MSSRRQTRRRLLSLAAVLSAGALALSACAGPGGSDAEISWTIAGANLSAGHMDPHTSQLDSTAMVQRAVFDSLVFQNSDGSFTPWLATEWTVSEDGKSYEFSLRKDVRFHDGTAFDAAAVKANFDHIIDPETASAQAAAMLGGEYYAGTEVLDTHKVRVSFTIPYAPFLQAASTTQLGFYSPAALKKGTAALKSGGPEAQIGTGPLKLTSYVPEQELVFSRNDDYAWGPKGQKAVEFSTLRVSLVPEEAVRAGVANSGESQIVSELPPSAISTLNDTLVTDSVMYPGLPYSLYLNEKYGLFEDQRVREAFALGINIDPVVDKVFYGQYKRAWSILSESSPSYDASLEGTWKYDADRAAALLDDAGWTERDADGYRTKNGNRLSVRWIAWTPIPDDRAAVANAVQSDLKEIGFEVVREALEPGDYNEQYVPKTFDLTDWDFSGVDPDLLRNHLHSDGFQNASQVSDKAVDRLLEEGLASSDKDERDRVYQKLQQWNAKHFAIVPLYSRAAITVHAPSIKGLSYDPYGRPLLYGVTVE